MPSFDASSRTHTNLKYHARALCAHAGSSAAPQWVVATNSLQEENEVVYLEYDSEQDAVELVNTVRHAPEVWDLATCSTRADLLATVWCKAGAYGAGLWRSPEAGGELEQVSELAGHTSPIRRALWHPKESDLLVTIEEYRFHAWAVTESDVRAVCTGSSGEVVQFWSGALCALRPGLACLAAGNGVQVWEARQGARVGELGAAHRMPIRDLSFSPANEHVLVSAGDDCKLRFWDLRMTGKDEAVQELGGHHHWIWRVQYNPFHEQLIASCSSDSLVNLWYNPPAKSAKDAGGNGARAALNRPDADPKITTYDEHEESVYGLSWSTHDPWLFASLSYDGRIVVNKVPKNVRYKILI